jgi:hypothetical protein
MLLVYRGSNGCVPRNDVCVVFKTFCTVHIKGFDNHQLADVPIETFGGVVSTQKGPVIAIMYQYALFGNGLSIQLK